MYHGILEIVITTYFCYFINSLVFTYIRACYSRPAADRPLRFAEDVC